MLDAPPRFERKSLLRLSWPLLAVTVFTLLAALGNVIILSIVEPRLNAAVATANQLLGVLYDISVLFSIGGLVVIAQHLGAGRMSQAQEASRLTLRASTALGLGIACVVAVGGPFFLRAVNTPDDLLADASAYLWIVALGMAFNAYIVAATAVMRAFGKTPALLILGIVVNILDIALLGVFLLVLDLSVVGAALPTLLVRGVGACILAVMVKRASGVTLSAIARRGQESATSRTWAMARLSLPTVIENGVYNLAIVVVVSWINVLGVDSINARSYTLTLTALVTGVILALAQGNETIVGWDVGAETRQHAKRLTLRTAAWTALASALLTLGLWLGADSVLALFGASPGVVDMVKGVLLISALLLPLSAVSSVVYAALRSANDVVRPMLYSVATSVVILAPTSWAMIVWLDLGLAGAFWALVIAEGIKAVLLLGRWLRGSWIAEATERHPEPVAVDGGAGQVEVR